MANKTYRLALAAAALAACQDIKAQKPENHRRLERIRGLRQCGPLVSGQTLIRRNKPCPCGSGRKFKACCREKLAT